MLTTSDLIQAAKNGQETMIANFLHSSTVKVPTDLSEALSWAAHNGHTKVVELLLEYGVPPNVQDAQGNTALHWASYNGHEKTIRVLLTYGADERILNQNFLTASKFARISAYSSARELALEEKIEKMSEEIIQLKAKIHQLQSQQPSTQNQSVVDSGNNNNSQLMRRFGFYHI